MDWTGQEWNGEEGYLGWRSLQSLRSETGLEGKGTDWNG
jgi:hypothetical protein